MSTKDKIMAEACRLLLDAGYTNFSMRKLASAVGISATAIYRHYDDKDALLHHVIDYGFQEFNRALDPDPAAALCFDEVLEAYRDFALSQPELYRLIFMTPDDVNFQEAPPQLKQASQNSFLVLIKAIEQERAENELPVLDQALLFQRSLTVWGQLHGVMGLAVLGRVPGSITDLFNEVLASCRRTALA